jgi:methylated-DNA-[protein]-cysteine S-methyltransferase
MNCYLKRQSCVRYVIFGTSWGYFGLAGTDESLWQTYLPEENRQTVEQRLLREIRMVWGDILMPDKAFMKPVQEQIAAYFEGQRVDFDPNLHVLLKGFSPFTQSVLKACRGITFGQTTSYHDLANRMGRPGAARAVGNALARNPIPLIIPCHRIVRGNGSLGGFSAPGGIAYKRKLLLHEGHRLE